jgi:hypothetical protein
MIELPLPLQFLAVPGSGHGSPAIRSGRSRYEIGRTTIKRILFEHGIDPAPIRGKSMSWATFIKAHLGAIAAADFFTVEVVSWAGLIRYHVLFLIDIATRRVEIAGLTRSPDGVWMDQIARTTDFGDALERGGVEVVRLPREARTSTRSPSGLCCRSRASASTGSCR